MSNAVQSEEIRTGSRTSEVEELSPIENSASPNYYAAANQRFLDDAGSPVSSVDRASTGSNNPARKAAEIERDEGEESESESSSDSSTSENESEDANLKRHLQPVEPAGDFLASTFLDVGEELTPEAFERPLTLQVLVRDGKMPQLNVEGGMRPYLHMSTSTQESTSPLRVGPLPKWRETFQFSVSDLLDEIIIVCYHWHGRGGPGVFLGQITIPVESLLVDHNSRAGLNSSLHSAMGFSRATSTGSAMSMQNRRFSTTSSNAGIHANLSSGKANMLNSPMHLVSPVNRGKRKGRQRQHSGYLFQEKEEWYSLKDAQGRRIGRGSGLRIRLLPWGKKKDKDSMDKTKLVDDGSEGSKQKKREKRGRRTSMTSFASTAFSSVQESLGSVDSEEEDEAESFTSPDEMDLDDKPFVRC